MSRKCYIKEACSKGAYTHNKVNQISQKISLQHKKIIDTYACRISGRRNATKLQTTTCGCTACHPVVDTMLHHSPRARALEKKSTSSLIYIILSFKCPGPALSPSISSRSGSIYCCKPFCCRHVHRDIRHSFWRAPTPLLTIIFSIIPSRSLI